MASSVALREERRAEGDQKEAEEFMLVKEKHMDAFAQGDFNILKSAKGVKRKKQRCVQ